MLRGALTGLDRNRLRLWLVLFFLALVIPTTILIQQAYRQLKWEAFHQHRLLAEELAGRIDGRFIELINAEEARSFSDYAFLVVAGDPAASFVQRSPLSANPVASAIPGLIGYFQVDARGAFSTPLLPQPGTSPEAYGISGQELGQRRVLQERIQQILNQNRLVAGGEAGVAGRRLPASPTAGARRAQRQDEPAMAASPDQDTAGSRMPGDGTAAPREQAVPAQAAFDRLNEAYARQEKKLESDVGSRLGRVEDLKLDSSYRAKPADERQRESPEQTPGLLDKRGARKERSALPEPRAPTLLHEREVDTPLPPEVRISTFESELDPFEFSLLDSGHFVLFRKVWRDGQRYIQGALIEQQAFLRAVIASAFRETALARMSKLIAAYQGNVFAAFSGQASPEYLSSAEELSGALLYQTRLSAPLSDLELIFSITRLPAAPGGAVITWLAAILIGVLVGGFYFMYRLGLGQIELARQQQDFVSAVSHELKTPLTSIRMYGELLREGWATEEKKKTYYDYIHDESERLSRLINNVLQLARMTRNEVQVELKSVVVAELMDTVRSKVTSQVERTGFTLRLDCDATAGQAVVKVDPDWFTQIVINLVDNAVKFSARAQTRVIDIGCRLEADGKVLFTVRDYGPGVPREQMKKIFRLFYRSGSELTRETVGTGIGLALVHQLALAMGGQVDVVNREPGAEFRLTLPAQSA